MRNKRKQENKYSKKTEAMETRRELKEEEI
jgi:hypothetical protein